MKLGIIGLPDSGKSTIFAALTGARGEDKTQKASRTDQRISVVRVADERVDFLSKILKPQKTTYARVEYLLPSEIATGTPSKSENVIWNQVRACDALIHVIRNFQSTGGIPPTPEEDFWRLEEEMILYDFMVAEKRIERIELDSKRGKKPSEKEYSLLKSCREVLENSEPIRIRSELASAPALRGFTFLSAKPQLLIINNDDEDEAMPEWKSRPEKLEMLVVRGRIEMEIAAMSPEEAEEFLVEYHIEKSALDRVIKSSYSLMDLISFFTVVHEEVRAWTITSGSSALKAAGTVHTDMEKGFIRAEVLSFEHLKEYGSFQEAKKAGQVRLEGKEYTVQDGDIINFRFNI
ncbi:MAG: redox-regulated ATPase YchF [Deltaproteobacteria bacterium]|nr:MAG: redox-regulated ATPase YchF [Deltaproteobacteria bacterium]